MVRQLTQEEQEIAARCTYRYLVHGGDRQVHAKQAARNFHRTAKNKHRAVRNFRRTLAYRKEARVDDMRLCFQNSDNEQYEDCRLGLLPHLESGKVVCRGRDRQNRALLIVEARKERIHEGWTDAYFTPTYCLYSLERALACSNGTVVAVFDYTGWGLRNAPPVGTTRQFLSVLQTHYPNQIDAVYLVNTPRVFSVFWNLIQPFVSLPVTFVRGQDNAFCNLVDPDQAMPFMLPNGQRKNPVDINRYLYEIPFDEPYDD